MLSRLSTRGNAVSGTMYSPGAEPPPPPEGWISPASTPPDTGAVSAGAAGAESFAAGAFAAGAFAAAESFFAAVSRLPAVSPPSSCSTADGRVVGDSPRMPRPRSTRSIAGIAFSSALVSSVIRNSRNALRWTMALARAGIVDPGQLHHDPLVAHLLDHGLGDAELVDALAQHGQREVEVPLGIGGDLLGLIQLQGEVHAALQVEAELERHLLLGPVAS